MRVENQEILILLATYNGEKYIEDQLKSLLNQTYRKIRIIISDDNSKDSTIDIIEKYRLQDKRIILLKNDKNRGILSNFNKLINYAKLQKNKYFMFCDQDDFWLTEKVEKTYNFFLENEKFGEKLLVYTNLTLVDKNLNKINQEIRYPKEKIKLNLLLHQNPIYGCTMMFNKELIDVLEENIPKYFIHHDHYVAYVAQVRGEIKWYDQATILYRQHGKNNSGSSQKKMIKKIPNLKNNILQFEFLIEETYEKYLDYLNKEEKELIKNLKMKKSRIFRIFYILKYKIFKLNAKGTINFLLQYIFWNRK